MTHYFDDFKLPNPDSHKGQNGKVLLIGGSELFHAASKWSLDILSRCVDMVFYSSVPSNNSLIEEAKGQFWNGIVIPRTEIENYVAEADCIIIGPGMTRERLVNEKWATHPNKEFDWNTDTYAVTNYLLSAYPDKKWVIDAGALQMVEPRFLNSQMIVTPHRQELVTLLNHVDETVMPNKAEYLSLEWLDALMSDHAVDGKAFAAAEETARHLSQSLGGVTFLIKGKRDVVINSETVAVIEGGNAGMTKGGTGDVLAGLVAALYASQSAVQSAVIASQVNKQAGDALYQRVGPFFNASDLVTEIPKVLWAELQAAT